MSINDLVFADEQKGWMAGIGGIYATTDGGLTWSQQAAGDVEELYLFDEQTLWAVGDGLVLKTTDGGQSWQVVPTGYTGTFYGITWKDSQVGWIAGYFREVGQYWMYRVMRTMDGGQSWEADLPKPQSAYDVEYLGDDRVLVVGPYGRAYLCTNATAATPTWTEVLKPERENFYIDHVRWTVSGGGGPVTLLSEDFSGSSFDSLPSGVWTVENYGSGNIWVLDTSDQRAEVKYSSSSKTEDTYLVSPVIDCSGCTSVELKFWEQFRGGYSSYWSYGYVLGSTDGGATWNAYSNCLHAYPPEAPDTTEPAHEVTLDMSWAAGHSNVRIAWRYYGKYDWWWHVDDVEVTGSCGP